jgi:hypothetical protein
VVLRARSLGPLEKTRAVEMTQLGGSECSSHARDVFRQRCDFTMHAINKFGVIPNEAALQAE